MRNNEELKRSHASGFGGSDAKMFAKIAKKGIESLSTTEKKRVLVALGKMEAIEFAGNVFTEAGHLYEEWCYDNEEACLDCEREVFLQQAGMARNFKVFAHADFYDGTYRRAVECKFVGDEITTNVLEKYYAQLQWYYMLGAEEVVLLHGVGKVMPFEVVNSTTFHVLRDDNFIDDLRDGIAMLDEAIDGCVFDAIETKEVTVADMDEETAAACRALGIVISRIKETEALAKKHKATLLSWMEANGVLSIKGEGFTVSYVSPTTRLTFDTKKAQTEFPALKDDKYYKFSNVKSSVKITIKE